MKKWPLLSLTTTIICVIVFGILTTHPVFAATTQPSGPLDHILPNKPPIPDHGALYDKYPLSNYTFDISTNAGGVGNRFWSEPLNALYSLVFGLEALAAKVTIYVVQWAFHLNFFSTLSDSVGKAVGALEQALFGPLLGLGFACLGLWVLYRAFVVRQMAVAIGGAGKSLLVVGAALALFHWMPTVLSGLNTFSNQTSQGILSVVERANPQLAGESVSSYADDGLVAVGNSMWQNIVLIPWQIGEFGNYQGTQISQDTKTVLSQYPWDSSRQQQVNTWANPAVGNAKYPSMTPEGSVSRGVVVLAVFIFGTSFGLLLLLLAGSLLLFEFVGLVLAALSPFILLFGLWPDYGMRIVTGWLQRFLGAALYKILISIFLSVFLLLSSAIYAGGAVYGWLLGIVLQVVLIAAIWIERGRLTQIVTTPVSAAQQALTSPGSDPHRFVQRIGQFATGKAQQMINQATRTRSRTQPNNQRIERGSPGEEIEPPVLTDTSSEPMERKGTDTAQNTVKTNHRPDNEYPVSDNVPRGFTLKSSEVPKKAPYRSGTQARQTFDAMTDRGLNPYSAKDRATFLSEMNASAEHPNLVQGARYIAQDIESWRPTYEANQRFWDEVKQKREAGERQKHERKMKEDPRYREQMEWLEQIKEIQRQQAATKYTPRED